MFAVLFGTRHADATEHQDGLVLAVALESLVKLAAFLAIGIAVPFILFDPPMALITGEGGSGSEKLSLAGRLAVSAGRLTGVTSDPSKRAP